MSDLCYLSATEARAQFRAGTLSPLEYLDALIARTDAVNPMINAYTETYFDDARAQAQAAEQRYKDGTARALEGIPVAIKDVHHWKGKHTTQGSWSMGAEPDSFSDPIVERLEAAGAILHARTTVPEFCLAGVCWSDRYGVTRNPHNPEFAPGGSSGGSGAAIAAGMTPLATGTDIGGSIRIPASACGLVGFKPPHGRNPDGPPFNYDRYNHCGILSRSVGDTALVQNIISGPHLLDHDSLRDDMVIPETFPQRPLKIAVSMDFGYVRIGADVRANTQAALNVFRAAGCTVEEVSLGWTTAQEEDAVAWYSAMHFGRQALWARAEFGDKLTGYALAAAQAAEQIGPDAVSKVWEAHHAMYQSLGPVLAEYDVLVSPSLAISAPPAEHDAVSPVLVDGMPVEGEFGWSLTHPFNILQNCPAMSVPSGRDRDGVPTGLQIVGRTFDDLRVFEAAMLYEAHAPEAFLPAAPLPQFGI